MKSHKHAELIKAWADGAIIQFKAGDLWFDSFCNDPSWSVDEEYRIKPEPKPDVVKYVGMNEFGNNQWGIIASDFYIIDHWPNRLKLTFDGKTGKLKSAEVVK